MLSALQHMHAHGVCHLDLKPDNILFASRAADAPIKLIDLGEAQILKEGQRLDYRVGTPLYMAPEMLCEAPSYEAAQADVWSAGVVLFTMLFGFPPFFSQTRSTRMAATRRPSWRRSAAPFPPKTWPFRTAPWT